MHRTLAPLALAVASLGCAGGGGDAPSIPLDAADDSTLDSTIDSALDIATDAPAGDDARPIFDATDDTASDAPPKPADVAQLTATSGWQIFPGGGYRYGPSILIEDDGSIDMFTCSPGAAGAWDFVRHRRSTDAGHTWSPDDVAIAPTKGTRDAYSACDPGAIKIGAYWYIGYTSTEDVRGTNNQLYLARASSPSGPYHKWDGSGWTGNPQPIVSYTGDASKYGIGEPSLVLQGKLYVYYSYVDAGNQTDLSIVDDPTVDDWPKHLVSKGHVIVRRPNAEDSTDVKFVDALGRFVGVSTYDRFGPNATIGAYQSFDGIVWEPGPFKGARVQPGAHNVGISGDANGHIVAGHPSFIAYAYQPPGKSWGDWPTYVDPVAITAVPYGATVGGGVSSIVSGTDWAWSGPRAWDGDLATVWSSDAHGAVAAAPESIFVDLGKAYSITGVTLIPRGKGLGFPVDFKVQTSTALDAWTDVPGESHVAVPNPGDAPLKLVFGTKVTGRYVRVAASKLGVDDLGNHYMQLAELVAEVVP